MADVPQRHKDVPHAFPYTIGGREMWFRPPGRGPLLLLGKYRAQMIAAQRDDDPGLYKLVMDVTVKTLNVINSMFLDPGDRDWVEEKMLVEEITVEEIMPVLNGARRDEPTADDAEVEVKPVKAVAKKTANAKRTRA